MSAPFELVLPDEPVELRMRLRDDALKGEGGGDPDAPHALAEWLWERWRAALMPAGIDRGDFVELVPGYRREIWFWLMGDRSWEQMLEGLEGRVKRRLPVPATPPRGVSPTAAG